MKRLIFICLLAFLITGFSKPSLEGVSGKITLIRVNDMGTKYGPANDQTDVEAVVLLDTQPGKSFGLQLRNDDNGPARQGMFELLKDAFANNWTVHIDYEIGTGKQNGVIIRVWITK